MAIYLIGKKRVKSEQKPVCMAVISKQSFFYYSVLAKCVKVGEGTYGEVYKTNDGVQDIALKVCI
jgi:hypothetical protein